MNDKNSEQESFYFGFVLFVYPFLDLDESGSF